MSREKYTPVIVRQLMSKNDHRTSLLSCIDVFLQTPLQYDILSDERKGMLQ
jgi:hypothetical protein